MKKFILFSALSLLASPIINCSANDEEIEVVNNFENADYIKSQMVGKWNYWGHFSSDTNSWWYGGDYNKSYFNFKADETYAYRSAGSSLQSGTYTIIPATKTDNAVLYLNYKENSKTYVRTIYLKSLEGKIVTIRESSFDERYEKE